MRASPPKPSQFPRAVSALRLAPNVLQDQKLIWLFPKNLAQGKYWKPAMIFVLVTAGLLMVDPYDPSYFRRARAFHSLNAVVSGANATRAMWLAMLFVLAFSLLRQSEYMRKTFFFALEAVLDSEILTQVLKGIDRRVRPQDIATYHQLFYSWFRDKGAWYAGPGSFPSGHMIAAISIATVFAVRYRQRRWAPWLAYSAAGIIGFSRITLLAHFPSDVFAGAFLGYAIARYVVLRDPELPVEQEAAVPENASVSHVEAMG